jgi:hypothetical protein
LLLSTNCGLKNKLVFKQYVTGFIIFVKDFLKLNNNNKMAKTSGGGGSKGGSKGGAKGGSKKK